MNYDNPAARLLFILERGKKIPANMNCRNAWQQLIGPTDNNAMLISRLGKVMELPEQAINAIKDGFPNQGNTWSHWEAQVNQAFMVQNLNANWDTFINHIDAHSINYLKLASDLLQSKSNTKTLEGDQLLSVRADIQKVYEDILSSDLSDEIKKYVVRYLRKILIGIDEYQITGAFPLLDSIETLIGHSAIDKSYHSFLTNSELGKRILDTLGAMANLVTVAVGIPQLSQAIVLLPA